MHRAARTLRTAVSTVRPALALSTLALVGACAGRPAADTGLNTDLALADQLQRRNAPVLVAGAEVVPAAAQDSSSTPARVATPARSGGRSTTGGSPRVVMAARPAARVVAPATGVATSPASASHTASGQAGTYDAGQVAGGEVASGAPSAPADQAPATGRSSAGQYGTETRGEPQAHTARDGILASVAGAIIGAAASPHDRVRGGLIGAVAGGALGAVYGHSADRTYSGYGYGSPTFGYRTSPGYRRATAYRTL